MLFQRNYFSRIWIVQDVVVSFNVQLRCGSLSLLLEAFLLAKRHGHIEFSKAKCRIR